MHVESAVLLVFLLVYKFSNNLSTYSVMPEMLLTRNDCSKCDEKQSDFIAYKLIFIISVYIY